MGLEPIKVELSDFNKLELLREEEERLARELAEIEKSIRDVRWLQAQREYLVSLVPAYYAGRADTGDAAPNLAEMEKKRQVTAAALEVVRASREQYDGVIDGSAGAGDRAGARPTKAKSAGATRSSSFQSFEDFRQGKG